MNRNSNAILGIGKVNLSTGGNTMFGKMWDCWEESETASDILVQNTITGKFMVVHTSGSPESSAQHYTPGRSLEFHHDQSRHRIAGPWVVVAVLTHVVAMLARVKELTGLNTVSFYTFK